MCRRHPRLVASEPSPSRDESRGDMSTAPLKKFFESTLHQGCLLDRPPLLTTVES